jgi:hypothetical protein
LDQLHGHIVSFNVPIAIRDLGPGGFSTQSIVPFRVGVRRRFRFTSAGGLQVVIDAVVRYRRPTHSADGLTSYITGFEFVQDGIHTVADIGLLLDAMTAVLQFEEPPAEAAVNA